MQTIQMVSSRQGVVLDLAYAIAGSLFIALCAQISVAFPFTPVPFTFQSQAVLLTACLMGPRRGFLAVCAYLCEGAMGLPVFALGCGSLLSLIGPTGGYLLSYLPASLVVGYLFAKNPQTGRLLSAVMFAAGSAIVLSIGWLWLSCFLGFKAAWLAGVYPFLFGDTFKLAMMVAALPLLRRLSAWG